MKALQCEMCGSNDLVKDNGLFVCQNCGCKYTVEEARKMMIEGTVEVKGTVQIDNTPQIQNFLELSENAYQGGNGQSAFDYANKALEIDPKNARAWIAKMKSIEYNSTFGNLRLMEVVEAGKNAVSFAADGEKNAVIEEVYTYQLKRALELLKLAMNKMSETADIKSTFQNFVLISPLTASKNTLQVDSKVVNIYDNVASEAIGMVLLIPDEHMASFPALPKLAIECSKQYQFETDALINRYKIYGAKLLDSANKTRTEKRMLVEQKVYRANSAAQQKESARKAERTAAYWNEHRAEKEELEAKKARLQGRKDELLAEMRTIPELQDRIKYNSMIADLEKQMNAVSLFKSKERKIYQDQIQQLKTELIPIDRIVNEKQASCRNYITELDKLIAGIDRELSRER